MQFHGPPPPLEPWTDWPNRQPVPVLARDRGRPKWACRRWDKVRTDLIGRKGSVGHDEFLESQGKKKKKNNIAQQLLCRTKGIVASEPLAQLLRGRREREHHHLVLENSHNAENMGEPPTKG